MRVLVLAVLAAQPSSNNRVGVVWDPQATVPEAVRQRVRRAVADTPGVALVDDALTAARWAIAYQVPRPAAQEYADHDRTLAAAAAQFRAGDLEQAASAIEDLKTRIVDHAVIPGAARLLWEAEILLARIAAARSSATEVSESLSRALVLDPEAVLSTRVAPPEVVARYEQLQRELLQRQSTWRVPEILPSSDKVQYEVDGRPGLRPLPPGDHIVLVRRPGRAPVAMVRSADERWNMPVSEEVLPAALPVQRDPAARICQSLELNAFLMLRVDGERIALQRHDCGEGFGSIHVATREDIGPRTRLILLEAPAGFTTTSRLADNDAWPARPTATPGGAPRAASADRGAPSKAGKPWYRRAWIWGLVGGLAVAGVSIGVALGTANPQTRIVVDTPSFTEAEPDG